MKLAVRDYSEETLFDTCSDIEAIESEYDPNTQEIEMLSGDISATISYVHTHISEHLSRLADTTDDVIMGRRFKVPTR